MTDHFTPPANNGRFELIADARDSLVTQTDAISGRMQERVNGIGVGDVVRAPDRDNFGTVIEIVGTVATVRFVNPESGSQAVRPFDCSTLVVTRRAGPERKIRILGYADVMGLRPAAWVIRDLLRRRDFAVVYGPPGCGKSFFTLSLGLCVASGCEWLDHEVAAGLVVYLAAEGLYGMPARIKAWLARMPGVPADGTDVEAEFDARFRVVGGSVAFLSEEFEKLVEAIKALPEPPVLIVVDTLARCMAGGDENSAKDMGLLIQACDRLREEFDAAVVLVHHANKSGAGERGSSALRGACDAMFALDRKEGSDRIVVTSEKAKESAQHDDIELELRQITVEFLGGGEAITSCFLSPTSAETEGGRVPSDLDAQSLRICEALRDSMFPKGATGPQLLDASGVPKSSFYRKLRIVVDKGYVELVQDGGHDRYRLTAKFVDLAVPAVPASPREVRPAESHSPTSPAPFKGRDVGTGLGAGTATGSTDASDPPARSLELFPPPPDEEHEGRTCDA